MQVSKNSNNSPENANFSALKSAIEYHQKDQINDAIQRALASEAGDMRQANGAEFLAKLRELAGLSHLDIDELSEKHQWETFLLNKIKPDESTELRFTLINVENLISVGNNLLSLYSPMHELRDMGDQANIDLTEQLIPKIVAYQNILQKTLTDIVSNSPSVYLKKAEIGPILKKQQNLYDLLLKIAFNPNLPRPIDPNHKRGDVYAMKEILNRPFLVIVPPVDDKHELKVLNPSDTLLAEQWLSEYGSSLQGENVYTDNERAAHALARDQRGQHFLLLVCGGEGGTTLENYREGVWGGHIRFKGLENVLTETVVGKETLKDAAYGASPVHLKHFPKILEIVLANDVKAADDIGGLSVLRPLIDAGSHYGGNPHKKAAATQALYVLSKEAAEVDIARTFGDPALRSELVDGRTIKEILSKGSDFWSDHSQTLALSSVKPLREFANQFVAQRKLELSEQVEVFEKLIQAHFDQVSNRTPMDELIDANRHLLSALPLTQLFRLLYAMGESNSWLETSDELRSTLVQACLDNIGNMDSVSEADNDSALRALAELKNHPASGKSFWDKTRGRDAFTIKLINAISNRIPLCSLKEAQSVGFDLANWSFKPASKESTKIEKAILDRIAKDTYSPEALLKALDEVANYGYTRGPVNFANPVETGRVTNDDTRQAGRSRAAKRYIKLALESGNDADWQNRLLDACDSPDYRKQGTPAGALAYIQAMERLSVGQENLGPRIKIRQWLLSLPQEQVEIIKGNLPRYYKEALTKRDMRQEARAKQIEAIQAVPGKFVSGAQHMGNQTVNVMRATPKVTGKVLYGVGKGTVEVGKFTAVGAAGLVVGTAGLVAGVGVGSFNLAKGAVKGAVKGVKATGESLGNLPENTREAWLNIQQNRRDAREARQNRAVQRAERRAEIRATRAIEKARREDLKKNPPVAPKILSPLEKLIQRDWAVKQLFGPNALENALARRSSLLASINGNRSVPRDTYAQQCYDVLQRRNIGDAREAISVHLQDYLRGLLLQEGSGQERSLVVDTMLHLGRNNWHKDETLFHKVLLSVEPFPAEKLIQYFQEGPGSKNHLSHYSAEQLSDLYEFIQQNGTGRFKPSLVASINRAFATMIESGGDETKAFEAVPFLNSLNADSKLAEAIALKLIEKHNTPNVSQVNTLLSLFDGSNSASPVFSEIVRGESQSNDIGAVPKSVQSRLRNTFTSTELTSRTRRGGLSGRGPKSETDLINTLHAVSQKVSTLMLDQNVPNRLKLTLASYAARRYNELASVVNTSDRPGKNLRQAKAALEAPVKDLVEHAIQIFLQDGRDHFYGDAYEDTASTELGSITKACLDLYTAQEIMQLMMTKSTYLNGYWGMSRQFNGAMEKSVQASKLAKEDLETLSTYSEYFSEKVRATATKKLISLLLEQEPLGTPGAETGLLAYVQPGSNYTRDSQAFAFENYAKSLPIVEHIELLKAVNTKYVIKGSERANNRGSFELLARNGQKYRVDNAVFSAIDSTDFVGFVLDKLSSSSDLPHLSDAYFAFSDLYNKIEARETDYSKQNNQDLKKLNEFKTKIESLVVEKVRKTKKSDRLSLLADKAQGIDSRLAAIAHQAAK